MTKRGPCAKTTVICTLVMPDGRHVVGRNWCANPQQNCPRLPGEGYEKCRSICHQAHHAEVDALLQVFGPARGAKAYLEGHTYVCKACQEMLRAHGVLTFTLGPPPGRFLATRTIIRKHLDLAEGDDRDDVHLADIHASDGALLDIAFGAEELFGIHITDDRREAWRTVGDIINTVADACADCD